MSASYEWVRAAHWRGLTDAAFDDLGPDAQARVLAAYRIEQRIQAVDAWERRPKA